MDHPRLLRSKSRRIGASIALVVGFAGPAYAQPDPVAPGPMVEAEPTETASAGARASPDAATTTAPSPTTVPTTTEATPLAEAPPVPSAPTRFGPFGIATPNGEMSVGFVGQVRLTTSSEGGRFGDGGRTTSTSVELTIIGVVLRGTFLDDRLAFNLSVSTSPSSFELLDFSLDGRLDERFGLRVGQFKTPFTLHRSRAFTNLPLTDFDTAAFRFGSERQIGLELHSPAPAAAHLDYALGVFTGVNASASFARGVADTYAETLPNPSNLRSAQPPLEFHPEVICRIGYVSNDAAPLDLSDLRGGGLRYFAAMSAAYDFRPVETHDFAARVAAEGMVKFQHVTANAVGYLGFDDPFAGAIELGMVGATVDATYRPFTRFEIAARFSRADTLERFRRTAHEYVDRIVAAADPADAAAVASAHALAGATRRAREFAIGANFPIVGRGLIIQTDVAIIRTDRIGVDRDTDSFRTRTLLQFQF